MNLCPILWREKGTLLPQFRLLWDVSNLCLCYGIIYWGRNYHRLWLFFVSGTPLWTSQAEERRRLRFNDDSRAVTEGQAKSADILGSIWWWSGGGCGSLQKKQRALHMLHVAGLSPVMDMYFVCSGLDDRCVDTAVWSGFCLYGNKNTHTRCSQLRRRLIPEHSLCMAARHHQPKSRICCFSIFHVRFDIPNIFHRCCSREWIKSFLTGSMEKPTRICCWGTQGICLGGVFWWQCLSNFLQVWINMQIEIWE